MSAPFVALDLARVADVLDGLGLEIEALGERLCADPAFVAEHLDQLQSIDRIAQFQHALAKLLRAECVTSALDLIGLDELADRLATSADPS
jgi:hypothetical protein